jgi:hypothetical protein
VAVLLFSVHDAEDDDAVTDYVVENFVGKPCAQHAAETLIVKGTELCGVGDGARRQRARVEKLMGEFGLFCLIPIARFGEVLLVLPAHVDQSFQAHPDHDTLGTCRRKSGPLLTQALKQNL